MSTETQTTSTPPQVTFSIPRTNTDLDDYNRLPDSVRREVRLKLSILLKISTAKKIRTACKEQAAIYQTLRGFSAENLKNLFYAYTSHGKKVGATFYAAGDWRMLVNWSKAPGLARLEKTCLPKAFIEFLQGLMLQNQRCSEAAIRDLYRRWRRGESVPGYPWENWQQWFQQEQPYVPLPPRCPPELPKGWSAANLRQFIPDDAELALAREGRAAARAHLPAILGTRVGLRPLEVVMFDDVRTDFRIMAEGQVVPLNLLVCIDVATGMILRYGLRPEIFRSKTSPAEAQRMLDAVVDPREREKLKKVLEDNETKDRLKLRDMKQLIGGLLQQYGYPLDYKMTFIVERGTAAIAEPLQAALNEISMEHIEVSRTMMIEGTAIFGGYADKASGNARGKSYIESTFNLLHNEAAQVIPGQIGARYDKGPAEIEGRTREANAIAKVANHLTPHQRAALKLPFLTTDQARLFLTDIFNHMIRRTDHQMEGFEFVGEWRLGAFEQWRHEKELVRLIEVGQVTADQVLWRTPARKESPLERWSRLVEMVGADRFEKIHLSVMPRLYQDEHKLVTVKSRQIWFTFQKQDYVFNIENISFAAMGASGQPVIPADGEELLAYFNPNEMDWIHLTNCKGGYVGSVQRVKGIRRIVDKEEMKTQMKAQRERFAQLQQTVSKKMPHVAEQHLEQLTHNNNVIEDAQNVIDLAPVTAAGTAALTETPLQGISGTIAQIEAAKAEQKQREKQLKTNMKKLGAEAAADLLGDE